jgi:hypothetical protein
MLWKVGRLPPGVLLNAFQRSIFPLNARISPVILRWKSADSSSLMSLKPSTNFVQSTYFFGAQSKPWRGSSKPKTSIAPLRVRFGFSPVALATFLAGVFFAGGFALGFAAFANCGAGCCVDVLSSPMTHILRWRLVRLIRASIQFLLLNCN